MRLETVDHDDVHRLVGIKDAIDAVRDAFVDFEHGKFELPTRLHLGGGQFLVMPTRHIPTGTAVVKVLSLNFERVPPIAGTVTWVEFAHARSLIIDAEATTALRTGAAVGVATDLMAPADATKLVMFGAGAQAFHQVMAVNAVRPLARVAVVDLDPSKAERLAVRLRHAIPEATVSVASDAQRALAGAEIVNCATTSRRQLFEVDSVPPTVHVNAIGAFTPGMRELPNELLARATVVVDDPVAALSEAGEIIEAVAAGAIAEHRLLPIGRALGGSFARTPITVFKSVGIAPQDWAVARLVATRIAERRAGAAGTEQSATASAAP
ncbi:ornithine cyclodeaminase family protein [Dactylosporangium sp. AC04546]|uniref:ornithine cyclodeaminase family protein n=1 Tax=Dactylosporangium sp. AC04546 TaxID=2862460 RepID=UPI002E7B0029|nr:ornithine cyclodeaminase family protein [Dactylosporangium sp. AC04546]WVK80673.1 ornithine cyclodeaminase family protein [Dactylosporangium sp. AC04546]